jgi:hypothetical protein
MSALLLSYSPTPAKVNFSLNIEQKEELAQKKAAQLTIAKICGVY